MLSKMAAQQTNTGGGRRAPLSLSGAGSGGNSNNTAALPRSQQTGSTVNSNATKNTVQKAAAESTSSNAKELKKQQQSQQNETRASERGKDAQNGVGKNQNGDKDKSSNTTQNGTNGNIGGNNSSKSDTANGTDKKLMKKVKVDLKNTENSKETKNITENIEKKTDKAKVSENIEKKTEKAKDAAATAKESAKVSAVQLEQKDAAPKITETNTQQVVPAKQPSEQIIDITDDAPETSKEVINPCPIEPSTPERRSARNSNQKPTTPVQAAASASPKQVVEPALVTPKKNCNVVVEDVEMGDDNSPIKAPTASDKLAAAVVNAAPAATSTPGKLFGNKPKQISDLPLNYTPDRKNCPRNFSQISGRRSIRPAGEFTPSHFRESYRRINTELDVTSNTNTSLNVTVGSERPNNSSFSFSFWGGGLSRKRERTPTGSNSQSTSDLRADIDMSPPKRARLEKPGFFSGLINSPMTALRSAFTRTSLQTPIKTLRLEQTPSGDEADDVQNVSGIDIEEELAQSNENIAATSDAEDDITVGNEASAETPKKGSPIKPAVTNSDVADVDKAEVEEQQLSSTIEDPKASAPNTCGIESDADANGSNDIEIQFYDIAADAKKASRCSVM